MESGDFALGCRKPRGRRPTCRTLGSHPELEAPSRGQGPRGRAQPLGTFWGGSSELALKPPGTATPSQEPSPFPALLLRACQSFCAHARPCLDPSKPSHDLSGLRAQQGPVPSVPALGRVPLRRPCSSASAAH